MAHDLERSDVVVKTTGDESLLLRFQSLEELEEIGCVLWGGIT